VKPFLKVTRAIPLDPLKPMATRSLINAVKAGETLVIRKLDYVGVTSLVRDALAQNLAEVA
jgi:hypothetical protein